MGGKGVFVKKWSFEMIHSDPASRVAKPRRAVADRSLQAAAFVQWPFPLPTVSFKPHGEGTRGTSEGAHTLQGGCWHASGEFPLSKKSIHFQSVTTWQGRELCSAKLKCQGLIPFMSYRMLLCGSKKWAHVWSKKGYALKVSGKNHSGVPGRDGSSGREKFRHSPPRK